MDGGFSLIALVSDLFSSSFLSAWDPPLFFEEGLLLGLSLLCSV